MEIEEFLSHPWIKEVLTKGGRIMVIGETDCGKTTLCKFFLSFSSVKKKGFLDLDVGQSSFLPATLNLFVQSGEEKERFHYFAGVITPSGAIPEILLGVKILKEKADEKTDFLVVDTTGYLHSPEGLSFKKMKIELLSPDLLICVGWEDTLPLMEEEFSILSKRIILARPSSKVRPRGMEERRKYREFLFRRYFEDGVIRKITTKSFSQEELIAGRLVGLLDEDGLMISAGIVKGWKEGEIDVMIPYRGDVKWIKFIRLGNLLVNEETGEHRIIVTGF